MSLFLLCQKNQIANVIIKYKVVQTGAKIQLGGLNEGLIINEYQGSLKLIVTKPPITEDEYVIIANNKKDKNLFFNMIILYNEL
jgi:hypothetical protein